jgi:rod shape-determining protein MreC
MFADSRFDYLSRVRYYTSIAVTPLHLMADLPSRTADAFSSFFQSRTELEIRNAELEEQLLMLQFKLQKIDHLVAENERLNDLLKASSIVGEVAMRAQLLGESPDPFAKRLLINKGNKDGVFIGQPVVDAYGLMGQVVEVEPLTSWVLLITDPLHATPVQVNRNGMRAIAAGTPDSLHQLTLENVPTNADIQVGDVLVTSGLDQRLPPGYPVGIVRSIDKDPGQSFASVYVAPTAQLDRSSNLLLLFSSSEPLKPQGPQAVALPDPLTGPTQMPAGGTPESSVAVPAAPSPLPGAVPDTAATTATEIEVAPLPESAAAANADEATAAEAAANESPAAVLPADVPPPATPASTNTEPPAPQGGAN